MKKAEDLKREVIVYPNPATDEVRIGGVKRRDIEAIVAWSRTGQPISLKEKQNGAIDVSRLGTGLYTLIVTCWDGSRIAKRVSIRR